MVIIILVYMAKNLIYIFLCTSGLESIVKMDMNGYIAVQSLLWRALTDNDRGSKFHIKSGSWLQMICLSIVKMFRFYGWWSTKIYAPDNNSYEGAFQPWDHGSIYLWNNQYSFYNGCCNIYGRYYRKIQVNVHYNGVKGLPEFPVLVWGLVPTLADKYLYKGLSEKLIRESRAIEGVYSFLIWANTISCSTGMWYENGYRMGRYCKTYESR